MRHAPVLLAALLAGAAGLGLELILLQSAGLPLGHGRAGAWGLSLFVAGWAVGAFLAGRLPGSSRRWLLAAGAAQALVAPAAMTAVLAAGTFASQLQADLLASLALAGAGVAQGGFLPLLLRGRDPQGGWIDSAAALVAANLAGSLAGGAWFGLHLGSASHGAAALQAGLLALLAGVAGASAPGARDEPRRARAPLAWKAGSCLALVTLWTLALEYVGLRLCVLWIGGMQFALGAALLASLAGLALGAALLPPLVPRGERGVLVLLGLALAASAWPVLAQPALAAIDPVADPHGLGRATVLLAPALLPLGAFAAVLHRTLRGDGGERLGALYLHEAWGALLGLPLLHSFVLPAWGLTGLLAGCAVTGLALTLVFARASRALAGAALALGAAALACVLVRPAPALASPPLAQPALAIRSFAEDRDFAVSVVDDGLLGERTLLTDGFRAAGTGRDYLYMQVLGHLPLLLHPAPERVAVLALGTGTTLGAVAAHARVRRLEVLELSRAVVEAAPYFAEKNHGVLAEGLPALLEDDSARRVVVRLGDGRRTLAARPGSFDVVTMEPLLPDSPFGVYLYTEEFYALARRALRAGGLVCQWVPPHALEPRTFEAVVHAFQRSFPWSSVWLFGTQVILLGAEREPVLDPQAWTGLSPELEAALRALGLESPAGLAARCVLGAPAPAALPVDGRLRDGDPWIVYLPRRSGAVLLGDLPRNLAWLRAQPWAPPADWSARAGERGQGLRALRRARERFAGDEARLRGLEFRAAEGLAGIESELAFARASAGTDPEVELFGEELEFLGALRRGVAALAVDPELALPDLVRAAELRGERADVHLYLAVALGRLGSKAAERALAEALVRCPRLARTREAARARELGLGERAWQIVLEADRKELR